MSLATKPLSSTGQPLICRSLAGTDRITLPLLSVNVNRVSSTTLPDRRVRASAAHSPSSRLLASSPALTSSTVAPRLVAAVCSASTANNTLLPTWRPAQITRVPGAAAGHVELMRPQPSAEYPIGEHLDVKRAPPRPSRRNRQAHSPGTTSAARYSSPLPPGHPRSRTALNATPYSTRSSQWSRLIVTTVPIRPRYQGHVPQDGYALASGRGARGRGARCRPGPAQPW